MAAADSNRPGIEANSLIQALSGDSPASGHRYLFTLGVCFHAVSAFKIASNYLGISLLELDTAAKQIAAQGVAIA